jgi:preprotein translocase subunit SecA
MGEPLCMNAASLGHGVRDLADYAQVTELCETPTLQALWRSLRSRCTPSLAGPLPPRLARVLSQERTRLGALDAAALQHEVDLQRSQLSVLTRRRRKSTATRAEIQGAALALVGTIMSREIGLSPYDTQFHAAWLMLSGRLVEMATGEGKTLTAALAAAVAGLAGTPVHVLTANDYLVQRDRDTMAPLYSALGLSSACVTGLSKREERAAAWQHDIVYATARELVFDYLRDHLLLRGERDVRVLRAQALAAEEAALNAPGSAASATAFPLLPGLFFCLIDEADSILLDEAVLPLILAQEAPALDAQAYGRVYELSCTLQRERDYTVLHSRRTVVLSDMGRARINTVLKGATGVLSPLRRAYELAEAALAARLIYKRNREYVVVDKSIQLIDELTGRIAQGRQWQGALQPMVELKEGLSPSAPNATAAQITYQQFFPRYLALGGMSGTLLEARHELCVAYGTLVTQVPLARGNHRVWQGRQCFVDAAQRWHAVLARITECRLAGRPVLVGTDSVEASRQLSELLRAGQIAHQLLNAVQDADEAAHIAKAGQAGMVTIATNIAGRGTDIRLDAAATAAGGLHVIATMCNRSRRIDRQLFGRAARHGDPGSAQALLALDDALLVRLWPRFLLRLLAACARQGRVPIALAWPLFWVAQQLSQWQDQNQRRELRHAQQDMKERYGFSTATE